MNKWLRLGRNALLQGALLVLILYGVQLYQTRNITTGPAPALAGIGLGGESLVLAARPDKPVLVHFWATWCPVCRLELGTIDGLAKDYVVITVAMEDTAPTEIARFMQEHQVNFPVLPDPQGRLAAQFGVRAVPTSFIVGETGEIHSATVGYTTGPGLRFRLWLAGL